MGKRPRIFYEQSIIFLLSFLAFFNQNLAVLTLFVVIKLRKKYENLLLFD